MIGRTEPRDLCGRQPKFSSTKAVLVWPNAYKNFAKFCWAVLQKSAAQYTDSNHLSPYYYQQSQSPMATLPSTEGSLEVLMLLRLDGLVCRKTTVC